MLRPRFIILLLFIVFTFGCQYLFAADTCVVQPESHPSVANRAHKIQFPDGRVLTVVGHLHGDRQVYDVADKMRDGSLFSASHASFSREITEILKANRDNGTYPIDSVENRQNLVDYMKKNYGIDVTHEIEPGKGLKVGSPSVSSHFTQDREFIYHLLQQPSDQGRPQFIGLEAVENDMVARINFLSAYRDNLIYDYNRRSAAVSSSVSRKDLDEAIGTSMNANQYVYAENPDLYNSIPLISTEDEQATQKAAEASALENLANALTSISEFDEKYWEGKSEAEQKAFTEVPKNMAFLALLVNTYHASVSMTFQSKADLEKRIAYLNQISPAYVKGQLPKLFAAMRERYQTNDQRDYHSALNLANVGMTGVHFVGLNHLGSTMRHLKALCEKELAGGSSSLPAGDIAR